MKQALNKVRNIITDPTSLMKFLNNKGLFKVLPDKFFLAFYYRVTTGNKLNLDNPTTFNEKLQWLKLHDRKPKYTRYVDKYGVREYIAKQIGEEYLIPLIGMYDSFDEIDFKNLPNQFVIKSTHDSGGVVICDDKEKFEVEKARKKINKSLRRNYYYRAREWPYKNVKPRIICEQYLEDIESTDSLDYKLFCFNGKVKLIQVDIDMFSNHKVNVYDPKWNFIDVSLHHPNDKKQIIRKPKNLNKMIEIAETLSKGIPHIRVDLYNIKGKILFGELTFFNEAGFGNIIPESFNEEMGSWIDIDLNNKTSIN